MGDIAIGHLFLHHPVGAACIIGGTVFSALLAKLFLKPGDDGIGQFAGA